MKLNIMKNFIIVSLFIFISGCAAGLSVDRISDIPIDAKNKEIAFLNHSRYDPEIKKALAKNGFTFKPMATQRKITNMITDKSTEEYNESAARYGLILHEGEIVDRCIGGKARKYDEFSFEIVDIAENESILFINKGGWTNDCFPVKGTLFNDLAKELANNWH